MNKEETIFGDEWDFSKSKTALIRSAAEVMSAQGPRAATLKNITAKSGVTEPAIFRHFEGVDGVFKDLYKVVEFYYSYFVESFAKSELSGFAKLEACLVEALAVSQESASYAYILGKPDPVFRQYPKLRTKVVALQSKLSDAIKACLKENRGELKSGTDVDNATTIILGTFYQVFAMWIDNINSYDVVKDGKKLISTVCALFRDPNAPAPKAAGTKASKASKKKN